MDPVKPFSYPNGGDFKQEAVMMQTTTDHSDTQKENTNENPH